MTWVNVTDDHLAAVPKRNIRVPLDEFATMWRTAERVNDLPIVDLSEKGRVGGLVEVCRWLAGVTAEAPVTGRKVRATVAAIEAEIEAIEDAIAATKSNRIPPPWVYAPAGRADGMILTYTWAWLGGDLPIDHWPSS